MNRTLKNIITIALIILLSTLLVITSMYAENNLNQVHVQSNMTGMQFNNEDFMPPNPPREDVIVDENGVIDGKKTNNNEELSSLKESLYILINVEAFLIGLVVAYFFMSSANKLTFKETFDISFKYANILITALIIKTVLTVPIFSNLKTELDSLNAFKNKDTTENSMILEPGVTTSLTIYNNSVEIDKGGTYTLTGSFQYSIIVNTKEDVTLVLDGVNIVNSISAPIENVNASNLTLELKDETVNIIEAGATNQYSENHPVISSYGDIIIKGEGTLKIEENSFYDSAIKLTNSSLFIESGIVRINSNSAGVELSDERDIVVVDGALVSIYGSKNAVLTKGIVYVNKGSFFVANKTYESQETVMYEVATGADFVCLNCPKASMTSGSGEDVVLVSLVLPSNHIKAGDDVALIKVKDAYEEHDKTIYLIKSSTNLDYLIFASSKILNGNTYYRLKKGPFKKVGTLINNIYYNNPSLLEGGNLIRFSDGINFSIDDEQTYVEIR